MYCSNCGQTQCYCYCRGCGVPWMNCQGQCGRPPMLNEVQQQGGGDNRPTIIREASDAANYLFANAAYMLMLIALPVVAVMSFGVVFVMPFTGKSGLSGDEHAPWFAYPLMFCVMIGAAWWWCVLVKQVMDERKRNGK